MGKRWYGRVNYKLTVSGQEDPILKGTCTPQHSSLDGLAVEVGQQIVRVLAEQLKASHARPDWITFLDLHLWLSGGVIGREGRDNG